MTALNFNNVNVSNTGQVTFSGVGSGIDFQSIENSIIQAKQVPIDTLQTSITNNQKKISDLQQFQGLLNSLQSSLSQMYGAVSAGNSSNDFDATVANTSSSRTDGQTPSPASNLLEVTTTNLAQPGTHQIQVLQLATTAKIASGGFNSLTTDLGTASGGTQGSISGSFTINGTTINVSSTDNLTTLVNNINAADTGTNPTGVTASIVSVSPTDNLLVLTADKTDTPIQLADPNNTGVLAQLGVSNDGGSTFLNQLQAAQPAQFTADGLTNPASFQSAVESSGSAAFSTYTSVPSGTNTFQIVDANNNVLGTVTYTSADSLNTIASKISAITGVSASVVQTSSGSQLVISSNNGAKINLTNDSGNLLSQIGIVNQPLVLTRSSNTIDDLFAGITINLFQAEPGTTVSVQIANNVAGVQSDIENFVQAYNAVREFINTENQTDPSTGEAATNAGPLFDDSTMDAIRDQLSGMIGDGTTGVSTQFSTLGQIGINFVDNSTLTNPTQDNTLTIDTNTLNQALLNNLSDVQKLFSFTFSSSNSQVALVGFDGTSSYSPSGYTLNLNYDSATSSVASANVNGTADGADNDSATVNGQTITATSQTGASGLQLFYTGNTSLSNVQLNFTVGIGAQMFFALQGMTDQATGTVQNEINGIQTQDQAIQTNITNQTNLLNTYQQSLTNQFNNAETNVSALNNIQGSLFQL
ncbi:MAG TPA: flagellar filament capping protein FliD, partial [Alphaproteobacteria bacterium]|nr:flagellar filament capping protein FliD [Alphaproteobacteria bacterium]